MERDQTLLKDIYKILGINLNPEIIDVPVGAYRIKDIDIGFDIKILSYKIDKISTKIDTIDLISFSPETIKGKVSTISVSIPFSISSRLELMNSIPVRRLPISWKMLSDEEKLFLLQEIKTRWPQLSAGIKIIGLYREVPIERIDTMVVDENTGVLSFNIKNTPFGETKRSNLLVLKFVEDEKIRSLVF